MWLSKYTPAHLQDSSTSPYGLAFLDPRRVMRNEAREGAYGMFRCAEVVCQAVAQQWFGGLVAAKTQVRSNAPVTICGGGSHGLRTQTDSHAPMGVVFSFLCVPMLSSMLSIPSVPFFRFFIVSDTLALV